MVYDPSPSFGKVVFKKGKNPISAVVFTLAKPSFPLCLLSGNFKNQELSALIRRTKKDSQIIPNNVNCAVLFL